MLIIGCDLHTRYQEIAMLDTATGEVVRRRLGHENGEARTFYANLGGAGAGRDRGHRMHRVVRADAGGVGSRVVGG